MINPLDNILSRLGNIKRAGNGYSARCPAHDDGHNSLSVTESRDGRALIKCHAGCSAEAVVSAIGLNMKDLYPHDTPNTPKATKQAAEPLLGRIRDTYDYQDAEGTLLFQVVRYEPKGFRQRRPNGAGGWIYNVQGVQTVLYRLPELIASGKTDPAPVVYIVEGEKDVDRLTSEGLVATTSPRGAGKWRDYYVPYLTGRCVVILSDNDDPGHKHACDVARSLSGVAASVAILELKGLPAKGDVSDWLQAGGTLEQLQRLAKEAPIFTESTSEAAPDNTGDGGEKSGRMPSQATRLVDMALKDGCELFHTPEGEPYACIAINGHTENWPVKARAFRDYLGRLHYRQSGGVAGSQAIQDALSTLGGKARYDGQEQPIHIRLAQHAGSIYLDLADPKWQAIEITPEGWQVVETPPVRFRRSKGMLPLPLPVRGGRIDELWPFLNVEWDNERALVAGFIVGALRPDSDYPILIIGGEQGSAKSTMAGMIRSLIDPNTAPLRSAPRNDQDLMIAATNSWLPVLDNLSVIPEWLSDAFCRLATGGGASTRELYADTEETILQAARPLIVTSIVDVAKQGDLLDRGILLRLQTIWDTERRSKREVQAAFEAARPRILAGALDGASAALRNIGTVNLEAKPRMADFAEWVVAASEGLDIDRDTFLVAYNDNIAEAHSQALDDDLPQTLQGFMAARKDNEWEGTATDLLSELEKAWAAQNPHLGGANGKSKHAKGWPKDGRALSKELNRLTPGLRRSGINIDRTRARNDGSVSRLIRISMQSTVHSVHTVHTTHENDRAVNDSVNAVNASIRDAFTQKAEITHENGTVNGVNAVNGTLHTYSNNGRSAAMPEGKEETMTVEVEI